MARSYLVNAVDVLLAADVAPSDVSIVVDDASDLPTVPFYLVVAPLDDDNREYMYCTAVNINTLFVNRNLAGTESQTHLTGDTVRISYVAQILDDLWDKVDGIFPVPGSGLEGDSLRKLSDSSGDYGWQRNVTLAASAPAGPLPGDFWMDTDSPGPGGPYLPLAGGTMAGNIDMQGNKIVGLTWQLWDVWKIRGSDAAGLIFNTSDAAGDVRMLQLTTALYNFIKSDDSTSALQYNRTQDFWEFGTEVRMTGLLSMQAGGVADINMGGDNSIFNASIITAAAGSDLIIAAFEPNVLALAGLVGSGTVWKSSAAGGIIQQWNIDGDANPGARIAQWRRSLDFGQLELHLFTSAGADVRMLSFGPDSGGNAVIGPGGNGTITVNVQNQTAEIERYFQIHLLDTTGSAANAYLSSIPGDFRRLVLSTSARKYKSNIKYDEPLADLVLKPVTFYREDDDDDFIGFIADDLGEQDTRIGNYDEHGEIENYDIRAVVAILAAKVNRLENA